MLALTVVVLLFFVLKSVRLADWVALLLAVAAGLAARPHMPVLDIGEHARTIVLVIAGLVTLPYWLGPTVIYGTQRASANPVFTSYDPARHVVEPSIDRALAQSGAALASCGFAKVGDFFQTGFMENMTSRVSLFEKLSTRQEAIAIGVYMSTQPSRIIGQHVEILARFEDGRALLLNNSEVIPVHAPVQGKDILQFPLVRDPWKLVRLHDRLLARMGGSRALKPVDRGGDAGGYLSRGIIKEFEDQIPTGFYRLDRAANAYRLTVKGALRMTWALLPPMSTIRKARVRRRAAELCVSLRVTEPDANPGTARALQSRISWPAVWALLLLSVYVANADPTSRPASGQSYTDPIAIPAGFTVPADFPGAVKALESLTGDAAEQLSVIDSLGYPARANGATIGLSTEEADALLISAQPLFLERGFFLFRHEPKYGIGGSPDEVALVPTRDQFAVVRLVGTNGANYDLANDEVIAWLRALERDAPFVLTGVGYDHLEGRFLGPAGASADSLAKRFAAFCPDVVNQGTGSVEALANEIGRLNTFFCWWD